MSFEQYLATCEAVAKAKIPSVRKKSNVILLIGVVVTFMLVALQDRRPLAIFAGSLVILLLLSLVGTQLLPRQKKACYRRVYEEERILLNSQIMTVSQSGIDCTLANGSASWHYQWAAFMSKIETEDAWVFLASPNTFVRVAKVGLTTSDFERIEMWSSAIPKVPKN